MRYELGRHTNKIDEHMLKLCLLEVNQAGLRGEDLQSITIKLEAGIPTAYLTFSDPEDSGETGEI